MSKDFFAHVAGQPEATESLSRMLASGRLPAAMILAGPEGVGKRTCAVALAAALLEVPRERVSESPRFLLLERGSSAGVGMDLIRERLLPFFALRLRAGRWRVVVVDGAETLGREAANALLKTLEEPPPYCLMMLLTTRPDAMLPTIRSRCHAVHFRPLSAETVAELLEGMDYEAEEARRAAAVSGGSVSVARWLLDSDMLDEVVELRDGLITAARVGGGAAEAVARVLQSMGRRDKMLRLLDVLVGAMRAAETADPALARALDALVTMAEAVAGNQNVYVAAASILDFGDSS